MEDLFKQSFNYAKIKLYKNYSDLQSKTVIYDSDRPASGLPLSQADWDVKTSETAGTVWDDPFDDILHPQPAPEPRKHIVSSRVSHDSYRSMENLNLYRKNHRNFFYTTNPTDSFVNHAKKGHPSVECDVVKLVNSKVTQSGQYRPDFFETTREKHFKKYYFHPFASIEIFKVERWIKRDGDKIIMKYFYQHKTRALGSKYYKRATHSTTIRFDMVKGNFLVVLYNSRVRNRRKQFYCNSLTSLQEALPSIFRIREHNLSKMSHLHPSYIERFNDENFIDACGKMLSMDGFPSMMGNNVSKGFVQAWIPRFAEIKKIKLPNDGGELLKMYYPTEKYLKKNDRKLVAAILDRIGILSKFTVKILHEHPNFPLRNLLRLCGLFGEDHTRYMGNIDTLFYERNGNVTMQSEGGGLRHLEMEGRIGEVYDVSANEKENMVHIINDMSSIHSSPIHGIIEQFFDHFRMLEKLKFYYPELKLNARKYGTFTTEHSRLSALERNIKKGYSVHNIFESHVIAAIEKPIEVENDEPIGFKSHDFHELAFLPQPKKEYHPVLLRTSEDYSDEGAFMHHCVAGYVESDHTIIVSLRYKDERVTSEYRIKDRRCTQSRFFQNADPPDHFKEPLEILHKRMKNIPLSIAPSGRKHIPLKINGVEVVPPKREVDAPMAIAEAIWDDNLRPRGNMPINF